MYSQYDSKINTIIRLNSLFITMQYVYKFSNKKCNKI